MITICTPTYNREHYLSVLYQSLEKQSNKKFEWVVIDDGSIDQTEKLISDLKKTSSFDIIYKKQRNQGKHVAINKGVQLAKGELFFIVDSDDRLPSNSIEIILSKYKVIAPLTECAGVVGLKCYFDGKVVGSAPLKQDVICNNFEYRYKKKIIGDRAEVFKTTIIKKYQFPVFENEKFVPESIVWNRIAQHYKMLFFNENVYECIYLEDGLSANSLKLRRNNPKGITTLYLELSAVSGIGYITRLKASINYWRFAFCDRKSFFRSLPLNIKSLFLYMAAPVGLIFYLYDSFNLKVKK